MKTLSILIKRNVKLFFKDKGLVFGSLISPLVLLLLYVTFLGNIYKDSFHTNMPQGTPESLVNAVVGGQLLSSLLAVSCVTVAFCSNMVIVRDKVTGALNDFNVSPLNRATLSVSYYVATVITTLLICLFAMGCCFIYLAFSGWYLLFTDVLLLIVDVFIMTMFGTAFSSIIYMFLTSEGQISATGTIVSAAYGFVCGAYMPINSFSDGLQNSMMCFPGTYGTALLRNHSLGGAFKEMENIGWGEEIIDGIKKSIDCKLTFFGNDVPIFAMYAVILLTALVLLAVYVLLNVLIYSKGKKRK